ncbi:MAG: 4-(cytidine 5'-diphospho)-2-C-methyl-D-erythritol kinase [Clostridia bacterium]|nr:4-(cytidine 5'-diphospho)-2-C-methyl-D-erythritol kinase [Clostridia bacterium]MBQ2151856.1 4-(cytidine 5'-diphospho)-2-C-methyl-D-erythritol kinase [Clostridia bacterium]
MEIKLNCYAKINLTLDIGAKRQDGYHDITTIMQSISLCDKVTISTNNSGKITLSCNVDGVPCDERNIAYKCAAAFYNAYNTECGGVHIDIDKKIPMQAGLAGGSADGAGVLKGLNLLYGEPFSQIELEEIGASVGSDIPFCIRGGTAKGEGRGTVLTSLDNMPDCFIVLVKPPIGISTGLAYQQADKRSVIPPSATAQMEKSLDNIKLIGRNLRNDFEDALANEELLSLKDRLLSFDGTLGAVMTGSGSVVYALFDDRTKAELCAKEMRCFYDNVFIAQPITC